MGAGEPPDQVRALDAERGVVPWPAETQVESS
jgi:hypothetical protein